MSSRGLSSAHTLRVSLPLLTGTLTLLEQGPTHMTSSDLHYVQKAFSPNTLGIRASTYTFGGDPVHSTDTPFDELHQGNQCFDRSGQPDAAFLQPHMIFPSFINEHCPSELQPSRDVTVVFLGCSLRMLLVTGTAH